MESALNSGRNLVIELSPQTFGDMVLGGLRRDEQRGCSDGNSVWVLQVNVTDLLFNWIEQRSDSPTPRPSLPVFYDLPQVRDRFPSDFSFLAALLGAAPTVQAINVRSSTPLAIAAGYDLDVGSNARADLWENFQENFLTVNGRPHDWGVAIEPTILQQVLDRAFAGMTNQSIEINVQTEDFFLERFVIESIAGTYGNPIQIHVRGEVIKSGPNVDVEFDLTGRFVLVARTLWLDLEMVEGSLDVDTWDGVQTALSDPWVITAIIVGFGIGAGGGLAGAAAGGGLAGALTAAIRFGGGGGSGPNFPVPTQGLGLVDFQLGDGSRFVGTDLDQRPDGLVIVGDATVLVPGPPRLVGAGRTLEFVETLDSACGGGPPVFPAQDIVLLNEGEAPLRICRIEDPADANFQVTHTWSLPVTLPSGSGRALHITYAGPRGVDAGSTIRLTCNDPNRMIREIQLAARSGGQPTSRVDPAPVVEVIVANTPTGRPVKQLGRCRAIAAPDRAAEFTIYNTGTGPLFLCEGVLEDPDGVFVVSYGRETLMPYHHSTSPILFYPTQAMHDYHATFRIQSNAGEIVIPIHGRVQTLPERTSDGMTAYLPTDEVCVPPDALCKLEQLFEPGPGGESILVQMTSFFDVPPGGELVLSDPEGTPLVHDYSGHRTRMHALAYTPNPDGPEGSNQACVPDFRGMGPGDRELVSIRVSGWVVLPVESFAGIENATGIVSAGGWAYVGTPEGLAVLDWREDKQPRLLNHVGLGPVQGLALSGGLLFAAVGNEVVGTDLRRPEHPVLWDTAKLEGDITALGASRGKLFALDGKHVSVFEFGEGGLRKKSVAALPQGVGQIGLFHDGVYVAGGSNLAVYILGEGLQLRLADRASVKEPFATLSHFGRRIFLSGRSGTQVFEIVGKDSALRPIVDYRQRHWSVDFLPDLEHRRIFRLGSAGRVERWQIRRRRLDRSQFQESLKLRYLPKRPKSTVGVWPNKKDS